MTKFNSNTLINVSSSTIVSLPAPKNISGMWNMGSLLFMCLILQLVSGVLLACSYTAYTGMSFDLIYLNMDSIDIYWFIRYLHANGASFFFVCLYLHIGRGLYYMSYLLVHTWNVGVSLFLLVMAVAFLGYVLPMNQMSFWGASVITNLFSEIPYIGQDVVYFIWGGCYVSDPTLTRFFTFHFMLPFVILGLAVIHITYLHESGSNNPLGLCSVNAKMWFQPIFVMKDLVGVSLALIFLAFVCFFFPLMLGDDENFNSADMAVTPHHIQPEWYFLFAYAILRSIPNKLGGVVALVFSVLILYIMPHSYLGKMRSSSFYPANKILFWFFVVNVVLLTWIGMRPVEEPYVLTGKFLTVSYFLYFLINPLIMEYLDSVREKIY